MIFSIAANAEIFSTFDTTPFLYTEGLGVYDGVPDKQPYNPPPFYQPPNAFSEY